MIKILIATPMMPPTAGGPATHAKRLLEHFRSLENYKVRLFNFEKLNKYPPGIRHFLALLDIARKGIVSDVILCLDGFSVALPATIFATSINKKLILRIGGDLVHEQYVESNLVSMDEFYKKLKSGDIKLNYKLKIKLSIQKFVLKNADTIVFTTSWQRDMYKEFYNMKGKLLVINNPIDKININNVLNAKYELEYKLPKDKIIFTSITRNVAFKNQKNVKKAIERAQEVNNKIYLESKNGMYESCLYRIYSSRAYICASISDISPNQVLEALSLGIPVIMTRNSGFYELLKDKKVCRFIDPFDVNDITRAILEMCDDNKWNEYKNNINNLSWLESWSSLLAKYEELVQN